MAIFINKIATVDLDKPWHGLHLPNVEKWYLVSRENVFPEKVPELVPDRCFWDLVNQRVNSVNLVDKIVVKGVVNIVDKIVVKIGTDQFSSLWTKGKQWWLPTNWKMENERSIDNSAKIS